MIYGIGNDIIEIDRISQAMDRNPRILDKLFTGREKKMLESKGFKPESLAGNFCAKEAVVKALGGGLRGFKIHDLEILRDELNKPYVVTSGDLKDICTSLGISQIMVTISHSKNYATATAIALI
ncbi:holo-ACP synthase [Peptostreptococcus stomatis]